MLYAAFLQAFEWIHQYSHVNGHAHHIKMLANRDRGD
jgi:hypothetical protein